MADIGNIDVRGSQSFLYTFSAEMSRDSAVNHTTRLRGRSPGLCKKCHAYTQSHTQGLALSEEGILFERPRRDRQNTARSSRYLTWMGYTTRATFPG